MIKKTIGGDRLGSGNRMKQQMHDFYRSNKNLSTSFYSTMTPGVLYPCYVSPALKADTFDIDLKAFARTIPTRGPLYGRYKLQIDFFQCPVRLYQAILHNNTTDIARKMDKVFFPKIKIPAMVEANEKTNGYKTQINQSSLPFFLNISGVGRPYVPQPKSYISRKFWGIPTLAYYDIFKNYYANKQEENAYVITPEEQILVQSMSQIVFYKPGTKNRQWIYAKPNETFNDYTANSTVMRQVDDIAIYGQYLSPEYIELTITTYDGTTNQITSGSIAKLEEQGIILYTEKPTQQRIRFALNVNNTVMSVRFKAENQYDGIKDINLVPFRLENIDDMRKYLLTQWDLGTEAVISEENQYYYPYRAVTGKFADGRSKNTAPLNGLVVKTYQSDLFNNWLDTEWINEITQSSSIDTSSGSFTIDMLNFKKKLYDHLNRLALSGGTYDDWQEATYGEKVWGKSEKPIYCGGLSAEIEFDEVVSTAAANVDGETDPLGSLGGRGNLNIRKGGHMTIKVGEACVIMGIASITPRLVYTQGNAWYNTELDTMDDLHKPIFDRIGFQDLMVEQMAWWDTVIDNDTSDVHYRSSAGKQPAWMNYATDVDRAYGEFAQTDGKAWMVLSRQYAQSSDGGVADVTTYIDPTKFNYVFAYDALDAQNFWVFINMKIHARRKMSNTQIPNV